MSFITIYLACLSALATQFVIFIAFVKLGNYRLRKASEQYQATYRETDHA